MTLKTFVARGATFAFGQAGVPLAAGVPHVIWAHGWGQDHRAMAMLPASLRQVHHTLIDFPGFGESPRPPADWDTADYADAVGDWLAGLPRGPRIWVGHSFGGRVGVRLAARHPAAVDAMVLVAAAGLRRRRPPLQRLWFWLRQRAYKALKLAERLGVDVAARKARYGSADYRAAGAMRAIFVKTVTEDLTDVARAIRCPVALLYSAGDTETPPEFGTRYAALIPGASLAVLPGLDHHTVLTDGGPQIAAAVQRLLDRLAQTR